jgi:hypothetical protein
MQPPGSGHSCAPVSLAAGRPKSALVAARLQAVNALSSLSSDLAARRRALFDLESI